MPKWLLDLLMLVWSSASSPLRDAIVQSIREWEAKARETDSPWDDILVGGIKWLLSIK